MLSIGHSINLTSSVVTNIFEVFGSLSLQEGPDLSLVFILGSTELVKDVVGSFLGIVSYNTRLFEQVDFTFGSSQLGRRDACTHGHVCLLAIKL